MHTNSSNSMDDKAIDFRRRGWYQCAINLKDSKSYCISEIYEDYWPPHNLTLTYSYPVYDKGILIGVGLHDIYLKDINHNINLIEFLGVDYNGKYSVSYNYNKLIVLVFYLANFIITLLGIQ